MNEHISKVKWWDEEKGFGFIFNPTPGERDIFVHHTGIIGKGRKSLHAGDLVQFDLTETPKGLQATNVSPRCPELAR
jgi:CspA family cold shock protein